MPTPMSLTPPHRPAIDRQSFRDGMAGMAMSICVVAARNEGECLGRTVTSAFSLTLDPPTVLVSIDIMSPLVDLILRSGGFSFAVLAETQSRIAEAFAGGVAPEHRFNDEAWSDWSSGQPRLLGAVLSADCELTGSIETGTHVLFAGCCVDIETAEDLNPLVWHQRRYRTLSSAPLPVLDALHERDD